jgi:hypothetical protein
MTSQIEPDHLAAAKRIIIAMSGAMLLLAVNDRLPLETFCKLLYSFTNSTCDEAGILDKEKGKVCSLAVKTMVLMTFISYDKEAHEIVFLAEDVFDGKPCSEGLIEELKELCNSPFDEGILHQIVLHIEALLLSLHHYYHFPPSSAKRA